jgi:hypothetical protein
MVTEVPIGWTANYNPCYIYYMRMLDCLKKETNYKIFCNDYWEDYSECRMGTKHVFNIN